MPTNEHSPAATSAITSCRNVQLSNVTSVPLYKLDGQRKNDPPINGNATNFKPIAAPNSISRDVTEALFPRLNSETKHNLPIGILLEAYPIYHHIRPTYNLENWRDPNDYRLPESTAAAPMRLAAMNGFRKNGRPPHNWSNYNNRARTTRGNPHFIDCAWIQIAHKYTIAFESICHCLELCGLRKETVSILFN